LFHPDGEIEERQLNAFKSFGDERRFKVQEFDEKIQRELHGLEKFAGRRVADCSLVQLEKRSAEGAKKRKKVRVPFSFAPFPLLLMLDDERGQTARPAPARRPVPPMGCVSDPHLLA